MAAEARAAVTFGRLLQFGFVALMVACPVSARADDYGKNLLLLGKALRDGNCTQAMTAALGMTTKYPERPEAFLFLGEALECDGEAFPAIGAYRTYSTLGGSERVDDRITRAVSGLARVEVRVTAVRAPEPSPFMPRVEYVTEPLDGLPDGLQCDIEGLRTEVADDLIVVHDRGCAVHLPPTGPIAIRVKAEHYSTQIVEIRDHSEGAVWEVDAELTLRSGTVSIDEGAWVQATASGYRASMVDAQGARHELASMPAWVPSGSYPVFYETDGGLTLFGDSVFVPADSTASLDLSMMEWRRLTRSHGEIGLLPEDLEYSAELTALGGASSGEVVAFGPGGFRDLRSGAYRVVVFKSAAPGVAGDYRAVILDDEIDLQLHADSRASLLDLADFRDRAETVWHTALRVEQLPEGALLWLDGRQLKLPDVSPGRQLRLGLTPGRYRLDVIAPWREPFHRVVELAPQQDLLLQYDERRVRQFGRARVMRGLGFAALAAGVASVVTSIIVFAVGNAASNEARIADQQYQDLDGGAAEDGKYGYYDSQRQQLATEANHLYSVSGGLLGVGGGFLGAGLVLQITAPRDPNRRILVGLDTPGG